MITFANGADLKKAYFKETRKLGEKYFKTVDDPDQIAINKENSDWIFNNIPECFCAVLDGTKVIGFAVAFPSTRNLAREFVAKKITEKNLFTEIQKLTFYQDINALYLCSVFIEPSYRGKGLAQQAMQKILGSIRSITGKSDLLLYFWGYSEEGKKFGASFAKKNGLKIIERKD